MFKVWGKQTLQTRTTRRDLGSSDDPGGGSEATSGRHEELSESNRSPFGELGCGGGHSSPPSRGCLTSGAGLVTQIADAKEFPRNVIGKGTFYIGTVTSNRAMHKGGRPSVTYSHPCDAAKRGRAG